MNKKKEDTSVEALKAVYLYEKEIYLAKMDAEIKSLGNKTKKIGTTALVVGGVLLVGYIVGRKLLASKKRAGLSGIPSTHLMVQQPKSESAIITVMKEQIPLYLMTIIKEKLTAYMKAKAVDNKK